MLRGINMAMLVVAFLGRINMERVRLVHGKGGRFSHELIEKFISNLNKIHHFNPFFISSNLIDLF